MTNSESKFYNTSLKMNHAMMLLLQEKNFLEISVAELCDKAKVDRTTFYSHYKNTLDLFKEIIDRKTEKLYQLYDFFQDGKNIFCTAVAFFVNRKYLVELFSFLNCVKFSHNLTSFF